MHIRQVIASSICVRGLKHIFGGKYSNEKGKQESNCKVQSVGTRKLKISYS